MKHIIFVHGAFFDGTIWERILPLLALKNCALYCPTLTGRGKTGLSPEVGLFTHVNDIKNLVNEISDADATAEIVLVGHRYGGMVINEVAAQMPDKIHHIIYVNSVVPLPKESLVDVMGIRAKKLDIIDGWKVKSTLENLGIEQPEDVKWAENRVFPQSLKCFTEKTSAIALRPSIAKTYIICTLQDEFTTLQIERVKQMGGQIRKIQASGSPMVTHPEIFAKELSAIL